MNEPPGLGHIILCISVISGATLGGWAGEQMETVCVFLCVCVIEEPPRRSAESGGDTEDAAGASISSAAVLMFPLLKRVDINIFPIK